MTSKKKKLPLSKSELPFTPYVYGSGTEKRSNNCYAFAIDWLERKNEKKLQPGELSKTLKKDDDLTNPKTLKERVLADLATKKDGGYISTPGAKCHEGYYKIMAFVSEGDYHFYRQMGDAIVDTNGKTINALARNTNVKKNQIDLPQNSDKALVKNSGLWAHKRGLAELAITDASEKFIIDPRKADRNYGDGLNYSKYVATFCVSTSFGKGQSMSCVDINKKKKK